MIRHMGHIALRVTDPAATVDHLTRVCGLQVTAVDGDTTYLGCTSNHHDVQLIAADENALDHTGLLADDDAAVAEVRRRAEAAGALLDEPADATGIANGVRVRGPHGHVFEVYSAMDRVVDAYGTEGVRPVKFEHVTLTVPDPEEQAAFLAEVLGFRISDRLDDWVACWMRCNPEHHHIALIRNEVAGLHHYAFQAMDFAQLHRLGDHLLSHGKRFFFGPGRHGPGLNLFCYHYEPSGAIVEYCADMLKIYDEDRYEPLVWPATAESINQWGPAAPPEFMTHALPLAGHRSARDAGASRVRGK